VGVGEVGDLNALLGSQHRGAERAQDGVVGRRAGVAAGPEAVQDTKGGEGAQPVLCGVELVEGDVGELVAGEDPVLGQQPTQLSVSLGESTGQVSQLAGMPIGSNPHRTTSGRRHLTTASESGTSSSARKPP
jgi:hypothetical protein